MLKYPMQGYKVTKNAMTLLKERYLFRDSDGKIIESVPQMFKRVADCVAGAEKKNIRKEWAEKFYDLMASGYFVPNTPTLLNAGRKNLSVLSGCFVIDVEDSISKGPASIFNAIKLMASIHKAGGGTGCSLSKLRCKGSIVSSTGHVASGLVSFMVNFNEAIESIQQGGMRRGADKKDLTVNHGDIIEFINCKNVLNGRMKTVLDNISEDLLLDRNGEFIKAIKNALINSQLTNINISVGITKEFKEALKTNGEINLINPHGNEIVGKIKAKEILKQMVYNAWKSGEPGFIDLDLVNESNKVKSLGFIVATNPCGEQFLLAYESCNLGSIAISKMLTINKNGIGYKINWALLEKRVKEAIRFLDNVIDVQSYPDKRIEVATKKTRKIGLGIMGFADFLIKLGIPYGSDKCLKLIDDIMEFIDRIAIETSEKLAKEKKPFPAYSISEYKKPIRNANRTCIAPTGSIAGIAGVSFGIEPLMYVAFKRRILGGKEFLEVNKEVKDKLKHLGLWNKTIENQIMENSSLIDCEEIPKELRDIFRTAQEIQPIKHLEVQARFQKHIDNAVSKTINLPESATVEDVENIFLKAIELKCKGVTVYRDGSRFNQVISSLKKRRKKPIREIRKRPRVLSGRTYEKEVGDCVKLFATINHDECEYPFEVFLEGGKTGGCIQAWSQALSRLISYMFRAGFGYELIHKQLVGITCHEGKPSLDKLKIALSCPDALARIIKEDTERGEGQIDLSIKEEDIDVARFCKDCGGPLAIEGRCTTCISCFKSQCHGGE